MPVEFLLIATTCAVAIVAAIWQRPPFKVQVVLIGLAIVSSGGSLLKAIEDNNDKQFMQYALIATLVPSNSTYQKFYDDLDKTVANLGYDDNYTCHHTDDGMTCFFADKAHTKSGVLPIDKSEVAELYANVLKKKSNQQTFVRLLKTIYSPSAEDEDFNNKVGIVGMHVFFDVYERDASKYDYDPKFGVKVSFDKDGQRRSVQISPEDISRLTKGEATNVFDAVANLYKNKFKEAMN
jgi:hypothetical protein